MIDFYQILTQAQIAFGLMLITGLLLYIAFFKGSSKEHRPGKNRR